MKTTIFLFILTFLVMLSCTMDEGQSLADYANSPYEISLNKIEGSDLTTSFQTKLTTISGSEVTNISQLSLGNDYYLVIEGEAPAFYRLGLKGGFDVIQNFNDPEYPATIAKYLIRPKDEIANGLALSVIVIHREKSKLLREPPKRFIMLE
ncbi:MAG: hypothetical protein KF846_08565 [Cyclobacteriaceae bacterium]|nr:hypothetical protein [Cyclobacteriaceae bacterium]